MISYASKIPNHPKTCNGCSSPEYDSTQCRLCWLATYDPRYRKKWGIASTEEPTQLASTPQFPCIYRSKEPTTQGVSSCCSASTLPVFGCSNPRINSECVVDGLPIQLSTARAAGRRVCSECGFRSPEENLEIPINEMKDLLHRPVADLPAGWENMRVTVLAYKELIQEVAHTNFTYPQKRFSGRGIVMAAGGEKYFKCALVAHHVLRSLGCTLPIQFWYLGPHEMDEAMLALCQHYGIEPVDASQVAQGLDVKPRRLNGWELKVFATLHSRFEEVLFLDADNVCVKEPTFLFDRPEYKEHGAIFWPDVPPPYHVASQRSVCPWIPDGVWEHFGIQVCDTPDFESGQFLIDKSRCWKELCVTWWINDHSDWFYRMVYGDKSTFHLAWRLLKRKFALPTRAPGPFPMGLVQHDFDGNPLFEHCAGGKQQLISGVGMEGLSSYHLAIQGWRDWNRRWDGKLQSPEKRGLPTMTFAHREYYSVGLPTLMDPAIKHKPPSWIEKAWSYGSAMANWIAKGRPTRTDEEVKAVLDVCTTRNNGSPCEFWNPDKTKETISGSCNDCGCRINFGPASVNKARMKTETCPQGFWV